MAASPNRKRKLPLDDFTIVDKPPHKKRKLCNDRNANKMNNIAWKNEVIFSRDCIDKLSQLISQNVAIKQYGFGVIDDALYQSVISDDIFVALQTVNGSFLRDIPNIIDLLKALRAAFILSQQLCCSGRIRYALKRDDFRTCFNVKLSHKSYDKNDLSKWLNLCNFNGIPPYMLLTNWLKVNKVFKQNKEINAMVIATQSNEYYPNNARFAVLNNSSFRQFCAEISMADTSCFQYEADKNHRSQQFEHLMHKKLTQLMSDNEVNVTMLTERQQLAKQNKNNSRKKESKLTPDILFCEPIRINNQEINWIDMKNFFLQSGFLWQKTNKKAKRYNHVFGTGAVICRGFQSSLQKSANCLLLEAFCDVVEEKM